MMAILTSVKSYLIVVLIYISADLLLQLQPLCWNSSFLHRWGLFRCSATLQSLTAPQPMRVRLLQLLVSRAHSAIKDCSRQEADGSPLDLSIPGNTSGSIHATLVAAGVGWHVSTLHQAELQAPNSWHQAPELSPGGSPEGPLTWFPVNAFGTVFSSDTHTTAPSPSLRQHEVGNGVEGPRSFWPSPKKCCIKSWQYLSLPIFHS